MCYNKYTGSRGKSGSNDANAEFLGHLRKIMDDNHVAWQTAELGKVLSLANLLGLDCEMKARGE